MRNPDREDHWIPAFAGMTTRKFNLDRVLGCTKYPILHRASNSVKASWRCLGNFLSVTGVVIGRKTGRPDIAMELQFDGPGQFGFF